MAVDWLLRLSRHADELGYAEIAAADKQGDDGDSDDNATDTLAPALCTSLAHLPAGFRRFWRLGPRIGSDPVRPNACCHQRTR